MSDEDPKWFRVSLSIWGDGIDPKSLEALLGLVPDIVGIKGEARMGKNGRRYAPYETHHWLHRLDVSPEVGFDEQIRLLFDTLGSNRDNLRELCNQEGVIAELFCGFSSGNGQGGDTISSGTLKRIADTGLDLSWDLYPPSLDAAEDTP